MCHHYMLLNHIKQCCIYILYMFHFMNECFLHLIQSLICYFGSVMLTFLCGVSAETDGWSTAWWQGPTQEVTNTLLPVSCSCDYINHSTENSAMGDKMPTASFMFWISVVFLWTELSMSTNHNINTQEQMISYVISWGNYE